MIIVLTFITGIISSLCLCYLFNTHWAVSIPFFFVQLLLAGTISEFVEKIMKASAEWLMNKISIALSICVLLVTMSVFFFMDGYEYKKACVEDSISSYEEFMKRHPMSKYIPQAMDALNNARSYIDNRLDNGATPYEDVFGINLTIGNSSISVISPRQDVVIIVQSEEFNGLVVAHAYVRKGEDYVFNLPNGTYLTSFYSGTGWNPDKKIGRCQGAFVDGEHFMKYYLTTLNNESQSFDFSPYTGDNRLYDVCDREDIFR